jgi:hypothetical protein
MLGYFIGKRVIIIQEIEPGQAVLIPIYPYFHFGTDWYFLPEGFFRSPDNFAGFADMLDFIRRR